MPRNAAHAHLYEACRTLHARLDSHPAMVGLLHPGDESRAYVRSLRALYAALAPAEAAVLVFEKGGHSPTSGAYVPRAPSLARELRKLGAAPPAWAESGIPRPGNPASCLGYRYVLEGSALGSRWLLQRLCRVAPGLAVDGLDYLRTQAQMAGNWPQFTVALNTALCSAADRQLAARAACDLFASFCHTIDTFTD